jgi:hypothetical protein
MLTATFRHLGGAARLPFFDFLIVNLGFDLSCDFAFFGMAGLCPKTWRQTTTQSDQ